MAQLDMVAVEELVREIARALVDEPAAVEVQSVDREDSGLRLKTWAKSSASRDVQPARCALSWAL